MCCRASAKASDSGKATLSLDHVLDALKDAGFEDMVSAVALQVNGGNSVYFNNHLHNWNLLQQQFILEWVLSILHFLQSLLSAFKEQQSEKKRGAAEASAGGPKKQKGEARVFESTVHLLTRTARRLFGGRGWRRRRRRRRGWQSRWRWLRGRAEW
jgi:hypothetical protein